MFNYVCIYVFLGVAILIGSKPHELEQTVIGGSNSLQKKLGIGTIGTQLKNRICHFYNFFFHNLFPNRTTYWDAKEMMRRDPYFSINR